MQQHKLNASKEHSAFWLRYAGRHGATGAIVAFVVLYGAGENHPWLVIALVALIAACAGTAWGYFDMDQRSWAWMRTSWGRLHGRH